MTKTLTVSVLIAGTGAGILVLQRTVGVHLVRWLFSSDGELYITDFRLPALVAFVDMVGAICVVLGSAMLVKCLYRRRASKRDGGLDR